jgi:hypothetical protein
VAILATLAARRAVGRSMAAGRAVSYAATFLVAFAVYETALFATSAVLLGGAEIYTAAIQGRSFAVNAIAFVGLLALHGLAVSVGFAVRPASAPSLTESHA